MNVLIIIISILTTIASVLLFRKACGSMSLLKFNTVSYVFYVQLVTSGLIASVLLVVGAVDFHPDIQVVSQEARMEAWLWTMYSLLVMPLTMLALNSLFNVKGKTVFDAYLKAPLEIEGSEVRNKLAIFWVTLFSLAVLAYVLYFTKSVPLYTLLVEGDAAQASIDRITSRRNFQGIIQIKNLLGLIVVPVIAYYSYILMRNKKTFFYKFFAFVNFSIAAIMVSHDTQKAPIAFFMLGYAVLEVFISKGISVRKFVIFFIAPVALILIGYTLTTDANLDQITRINSAFYGRTFLTGYFGFPLSLELFPDVIVEQTYGVGVPKAILQETGLNMTESARLLKMYVHPESIVSGRGNLYSGFYMGEAWANYGYVGLIIAPMIVGFVVQAVHLFVIMNKKSPLLLAFYAGLTVKWVVGAGFTNFLFLKLLIWPLILYSVFNFFLKRILKSS